MVSPIKSKLLLVASSLFSSFLTAAESTEAVVKMTPAQSLMPMLLGLAGILVVIFVLAILVKKITGLNLVSNNIKVIESQNLGAKEKLVIVEIQQQQFVLGVTAHAINQICQLQQPIEKKKSSMPFEKMLKQLIEPHKFLNKQPNVTPRETNS